MARPDSLRRTSVLWVSVVAESLSVVLNDVASLLADDARENEYLCPTGVHGVIEAQDDPGFRSVLNRAKYDLSDRMPLVRVARFRGYHTAGRAFGPDVMRSIIARTSGQPVRHSFYGGREGVAEELAKVLSTSFPRLQVAGTHCPPFREVSSAELEAVAAQINECGADVVWVGLSTPKQERWIHEIRPLLNVKLICSVGAVFDYLTGSITRAAKWMQAASLEWLFRVLQEPRRLWRRYVKIVPRFIFLVTIEGLGIRRPPKP